MMPDYGTPPWTAVLKVAFGFTALLVSTLGSFAAESIHPDTVTPGIRLSDAPSWELGVIFQPLLNGTVTHARVYSLAEESGDHVVTLWRNADGAVIAGPLTVAFGGDDAWIDIDIPDTAVSALESYTLSITTTVDGWYPANSGYFDAAGDDGLYLAHPHGAGVFNDTAGSRPTGGFGNASYLRDVVFEPDLSGAILRLSGNGGSITDGATNTSTTNATRILGKGLTSGSRDQVYTLSNPGQTAVELTGNPRVLISGEHAADFVVTEQPPATVPGGGSATFTVRFDPSAIGLRQAGISIAHADSAEKPFRFNIDGYGLGGGAGVLGNDSDGTFARNIDDTQIHGNRFAAPVAMRITEVHARLLALEGTFKCAVYSDVAGSASQLLGASVEVVNATNGWNTFTLTAPVDLVAGDAYWLVLWSDTVGARVQADPVGQAYQAFYSYVDLGGAWPETIALITPVAEGPRTYCLYAEGTPLGSEPGPEMDLRGNGKLIVSGDSTPSALDGSDLGDVNVGASSPDRVFTLENKGDAPLELGPNAAVVLSGTNPGDFSVAAQPSSPIPPGGNATFSVRFSPTSRGLRSAIVTLHGNDADEGALTFAVQGSGLMSGRESIWPDNKVGGDVNFDGTYYELGTIFRSSIAGKVTHLRVYSLAAESGEHTARLWRNDDESIVGGPYTWTYGGTAGWISLDIPDVDIEADVDYTVSVSTGTSEKRNYPNLAGDVAAAGGNNLHLTHPIDAGVFTTVAEGRPTESFNHGNYLRDVWFVPAGTVVELPAISVTGNNLPILDGSSTPNAADNTDFGSLLAGATIQKTFSVTNAGTAPLHLTGNPAVTLLGAQAGSFSVTSQPATPVAPGGTVDFVIRFSPAAAGAHAATVSLDNDSDAGTFDFAIGGVATGAPAGPHILEVRPDLAAGSITLRWEGDGPQFQVEKAAAITGPFTPAGTPQTEKSYTDPDALRNGAQGFYRVRKVP